MLASKIVGGLRLHDIQEIELRLLMEDCASAFAEFEREVLEQAGMRERRPAPPEPEGGERG